MNQQKLRHGQALAMQWVAFALQKISSDADKGGRKSRLLLGDNNAVNGTDGFKTLALGCNYVINFILPLSIELALKALIAKENKKKPPKTHNLSELYRLLPSGVRGNLEEKYAEYSGSRTSSFEELLNEHLSDFEKWRYLDNPKILKREEIKMQYGLSAILDIYNQ